MKRTLFLVSDRTGITVETLVQSLIAQFDDPVERRITLPFVDTPAKVNAAVQQINQIGADEGILPIVFSSLIDPQLREQLKTCDAVVFDFLETFLQPLSQVLGKSPKGEIGLGHAMGEPTIYDARVEAVNFALNYDDGIRLRDLGRADVILLGVSRSGKTPTCLYLGMHYGALAANYPLTEEDFARNDIPEALKSYREKLFGLTIAPERLHKIREERRPDSSYSALATCRKELLAAEALYKSLHIPYLDSTAISIEEMAAAIMHQARINRRIF